METKSTFCRNRQAKSHYIKPALNILLTNAKLKIINRRKKETTYRIKMSLKRNPILGLDVWVRAAEYQVASGLLAKPRYTKQGGREYRRTQTVLYSH